MSQIWTTETIEKRIWSDKTDVFLSWRNANINRTENMNEEQTTVNDDEVIKVSKNVKRSKVGRVLPMVIWSEFRMEQYRNDDHRE